MSERRKENHKFNGVVRELRSSDLESLRPILETWIRSDGAVLHEEVEEDLEQMRTSINRDNDSVYLVAEDEGKVVGVIGLRTPDSRMMDFVNTQKPAELINAYVAEDHRSGGGVGTALVSGLEDRARAAGFTEIVLNSGPRYKDTGWGFYDKFAGYNRVGVAEGYYGSGINAPVWRKEL